MSALSSSWKNQPGKELLEAKFPLELSWGL
jgi:hypothetical protein